MSDFLIAPEYGFIMAGLLFAVGVAGVLVRRNLIFMLFALEIMLNSSGFAFVIAGAKWAAPDGQIMFLLVLSVAAAEAAVALALMLRFKRVHKNLNVDCARQMKG